MLTSPIQLPCGVTLANRLVKAAMTERISNASFEPTADHERLYQRWSNTGAGLLITGNVMIDRVHLESAGNVAFDDPAMLPALRRWAQAAQSTGNACWVQVSHAGRQVNRFSTARPFIQCRRYSWFFSGRNTRVGKSGYSYGLSCSRRCCRRRFLCSAAHSLGTR